MFLCDKSTMLVQNCSLIYLIFFFCCTRKVAAVFWMHTMFLIYCCVHISLFACLILSVGILRRVQTAANDSKDFEIYSLLSFCLYLLKRQEHLSSKSFTDFNSSAFMKHTGFMRKAHQSHSYFIFICINQSSISHLYILISSSYSSIIHFSLVQLIMFFVYQARSRPLQRVKIKNNIIDVVFSLGKILKNISYSHWSSLAYICWFSRFQLFSFWF